jgi:hypothetical protein
MVNELLGSFMVKRASGTKDEEQVVVEVAYLLQLTQELRKDLA